ncbi:MAG TPA: hypothetical protein VFM98_11435 [Ramlibacter sp.]|uniref:hypothetical protein n=1 Tax=Ramlibacter sp. TaxID=1917967 RepID=UPI002D7E87D0|nr:hypothetical protein [Ramlibacter sp.]HET8746209.1 hypothetical protein [Ramlibacter sp.]
MSMQTSWAATHFCDEAARAGQAPSSHRHAQLFPSHDDHAAEAGGTLDDACCSVAHAYHGLQAFITQDLPAFALLALPAAPAEAALPATRERFSERHERPQWPAA